MQRDLSIIDSIRLRPGMYIGSPDRGGVAHLVNELVANSVDQYIAGQATRVAVSQQGDRICVEDDGPGLPYDQQHSDGRTLAESFFVELHHTPTADGHSPHIHLNRSGVGLIVASALSSHLEVVTHRAGFRWKQYFERGVPVSDPLRAKSKERGTSITFLPDSEVLSAIEPEWNSLRHKLFEVAHLFPGIRIGCREEVFHMPDGLLGYALFLESAYVSEFMADHDKPILDVNVEIDGVRIVASACGTAKVCEWHSWCSGLRTDQHGTHVAGFKEALKSAGWTPAVAMVHVQFNSPKFGAPTKSKLINESVRASVRRAIKAHLKSNPWRSKSETYRHA